jgi:hypothetical protein
MGSGWVDGDDVFMIGRLSFLSNRLLGMRWKLVAIIFLIGFCMRAIVFTGTHEEGDELIYMNLVAQLDQGHGYTLHKSALLEQGFIDREQYDRPLFFHPPGGIALNWLFYEIFGTNGFPLVQILSYTLFFWSMMLLADSLRLLSTNLGMALVAALTAFNPIMAHVTTKFWLDGPLLAFTTLAVSVFAWAVVQNKLSWGLISGLLLGFASLVKAIAFLIIPGTVLMGWFLFKAQPKPAGKWRKKQLSPPSVRYLRFVFLLLVPAVIVQLPWEIWQWIVCGSPFPGWAGKPSVSLIATNNYVHYLTVIRPPWVYLTLTVRVLWTLIPAGLLYVVLWKRPLVRRQGTALIVWILTVLLFHVSIGYYGYSKVLRYIILITPASVMLFPLLLNEAVEKIMNAEVGAYKRWGTVSLVAISALALILEITAGIYATIAHNNDLIFPILGKYY